jgi:hypothetical protein
MDKAQKGSNSEYSCPAKGCPLRRNIALIDTIINSSIILMRSKLLHTTALS